MNTQNTLERQNEALNRFNSALGGEMLDGTDLSSPAAKEAMAAILLSAQSPAHNENNMSVSMVKRALGLGM